MLPLIFITHGKLSTPNTESEKENSSRARKIYRGLKVISIPTFAVGVIIGSWAIGLLAFTILILGWWIEDIVEGVDDYYDY